MQLDAARADLVGGRRARPDEQPPAALGADALGADALAYDPATCALLSNSISQEPLERISFERVCNSIVKAKMRFRLFAVEYDPAHEGRAKPK